MEPALNLGIQRDYIIFGLPQCRLRFGVPSLRNPASPAQNWLMRHYLYFLPLVLGLALTGCDNEDQFVTDGSFDLSFSVDTLRFDTVFTALGSATRFLKVYNPLDEAIIIDRVRIEGNESGRFRMNVDGTAGETVEQVKIWPNDSVYVFVETTIDPDQPLSVSPFVIEDRVLFEFGGKQQSVLLEAWGQNANYFPSRFSRGTPTLLSCNNQTIVWDDPKPYVIYGQILIDSCALEVAAGTQIYVHGGIAENELFGIFNDGIIYTLQNGQINFRGTAEAPITVQGDRLEASFEEEAGQWQGIIIGRGSRGNTMAFTEVKNAIFSVYVDSLGEFSAENSRFYNSSSSGIIGFSGSIQLKNCLVYNNGGNSIQLVLGGNYEFDYCTVASYGVDASAMSLSNFFCYDDPGQCQTRRDFPLRGRFRNCIFFGSSRDELNLNDISGGSVPSLFDIRFENCILKTDRLFEQQDSLYADFFTSDLCVDCINGTRDDPLFADSNEDNYRLDTLSIAEGQARPLPGLKIDIDNNERDPSEPDIGCFEYQN